MRCRRRGDRRAVDRSGSARLPARAAARVPGAGHHDGARPAAAEAERQAGPRCAAVAAVTDGRSTPQDLLDFLRERLPEYLVPATMTVLDRLPLRPSGNLDRDALPSPRPVS